MLKLQQHTHTELEMLKLPNSQLNDAHFGDDETLRELFRRKRHIMGDQIVLLPHQTTVNFFQRMKELIIFVTYLLKLLQK